MQANMIRTAIVLGLVFASGCVSSERYEAASTEVTNLDSALEKSKEENARLRREVERLENELALARLDLDKERQKGLAAGDVSNLKAQLDELRRKLSGIDDDITIRPGPGGVALSVEGQVLFRPGSDEVSERGKELLNKIADRLKDKFAEHKIRVDGHTDNIPVRLTIDKYPLGNLQLSGTRSLKVAAFLIDECGLERERVSFAGFGAELPVADNVSDDGREQNRRVDIVVLTL